ncbi:phosphoribosylaminoimidazolesuccinocarboxamide synthase [Lusitaniella coriacea LEGE 07157]|uniref:Phosphoribosylaminoimidazole-succinocarboxamide synthase n=1 Tax=Lusitaniella coriacea LEGE 07157 TaxID=945747 RepID=A0A8J7DWC6_9CYAN|nr:phosphoribosylaminoimidazolesuccinocarboxamide synthase [Lusitaniella coriacea]MBE9116376.1 phosphoribosylaminoimidazolesuccinocarboxamide synthase [Lusitaniella coriacea LEGE 07157]
MSSVPKRYEGKAKIIYPTDEPDIFLAHFKDDATAFNALKRGQIQRKGEVNCRISALLFEYLETQGIVTHYLEQTAPNQMRIRAVEIIPLEVVVRNVAAGSLCRQTGLPEGKELPAPLVEFYLKDDDLGDPLLTRDRALLLELVTPEQLEQLKDRALEIDRHLQELFAECGILLVDFKLEFGFDRDRQLRLADEISPDTCRLWNQAESDPQKRVMDKDRFRRDLGQIEAAYQQVLQRVEAVMTQKEMTH